MAVRLHPTQVCFVVDDVRSAAAECSARFGWGPFHQFKTEVARAHYRDWTGRRDNDVAVGMAGRVQVELLHVNEGREPVADYQARYGTGFQHLGIACRSIEEALSRLEALGAVLADENEHEGIRIGFVDVPTGPAMFELLQFPPESADPKSPGASRPPGGDVFALDRATIATHDMERALAFYAAAFDWCDAEPRVETLRHGSATSELRRFVGRAGALTLELLEPRPGSGDPYAAHLARADHGLVHAGGHGRAPEDMRPALQGEWLEASEAFTLHDFPGGRGALQFRG